MGRMMKGRKATARRSQRDHSKEIRPNTELLVLADSAASECNRRVTHLPGVRPTRAEVDLAPERGESAAPHQ